MVAETEIVCSQQSVAVSVPVLDVSSYFGKANKIEEIQDIVKISPPVSPRSFNKVRVSESVSTELSSPLVVSFLFSDIFHLDSFLIRPVFFFFFFVLLFDRIFVLIFCYRITLSSLFLTMFYALLNNCYDVVSC